MENKEKEHKARDMLKKMIEECGKNTCPCDCMAERLSGMHDSIEAGVITGESEDIVHEADNLFWEACSIAKYNPDKPYLMG